MEAIALLIDLTACYRAVDREAPQALKVMLELLVPPLLALRHGDGGLGSWHGAGATSAERMAALIDASGVRTSRWEERRGGNECVSTRRSRWSAYHTKQQ